MYPIYFPFTFISEPVAQMLCNCFKQIIVYQPSLIKAPETMRQLAENKIINLRIPVKGDEDKLEATLKDFHTWIEHHRGSETFFLKTGADSIPFFNDTYTPQIRADIKKNSASNQPKTITDKNRLQFLYASRVFLHIAQEFDLQNFEINLKLSSLNKMEQELMTNIKGEYEAAQKEDVENKALIDDGQSHYMASERIKAWFRLMLHDQEISGLFITSSRFVFEHIIDKAIEVEIVFDSISIPVCKNRGDKFEKWHTGLMKYLKAVATNDRPVLMENIEKTSDTFNCDKKVFFTLYMVPEKTPYEFFAECTGHDLKPENNKTKYKNTLIGLIE